LGNWWVDMVVLLVVFIILAVIFQISLACVDAFFNRMIRNNIENWEDLDDYHWITLFLLFFCTFIPVGMIWMISEFHALIYGICYCIVQWDVIFGRIVYGKWLGDTPSMKIGGKWFKMKLRYVFMLKGLIAAAATVYLVIKYF
jgi:hypothetical protein